MPYGAAGPQHPRAPATAGPPPRLGEVGAGPGSVEGLIPYYCYGSGFDLDL